MIFILDTDTCVYFLNGTYRSIADEVAARPLEELATTSISAAELFYGAHHSSRKAGNLESLKKFLQRLKVLPFDKSAAEEFGILKQSLTRQRKMIGPYDLQIASIVRSQKGTLVTHNTKGFALLRDLSLVDWVRS